MGIYKFEYDNGSNIDFNSGIPDFRSDSEQSNSSLSIYDSDAPEIRTARTLADEIINVSGAEVQVFIRTDNKDVDVVWDEDADPTYWSSERFKAHYKPGPLEAELKKWGADTITKTQVIFSHRQVYQKYGNRMIRPGDVITLPFNSSFEDRTPKHFRVLNGTPSGNFRYVWLYFACDVETLNADVNVRPIDAPPLSAEEPMRYF